MNKKVVTFGEIMLRLQPQGYKRVMQAESFEAFFGGCEANVAAALSQWGVDAAFATKLPKNGLGDSCLRYLRGWGIDTSNIAYGDGRLGIYFTAKGASQRPPEIIYDRSNSDFSLATLKDFDFNKIFEGAGWFHFSGITPALGNGTVELTKAAVSAAHEKKLKISCDLNFRSKLWNAEDCAKTMGELIRGIDVLIVNENQLNEVFGIKCDSNEEAAKAVMEKFQIGTVALTKRRTISGEVNEFSSMLFQNGGYVTSRTYSIFMIDKIGGGDSFSAGIIYGILQGKTPQDTVDFATAAACYKHTIEGDMIAASIDDIDRLCRSDGRGRLVR